MADKKELKLSSIGRSDGIEWEIRAVLFFRKQFTRESSTDLLSRKRNNKRCGFDFVSWKLLKNCVLRELKN